MKTKNILLDTSIVLDNVNNITTIDKYANVFVTDVVLRELDGNKGAEEAKGYNAREFFRQFNSNEFTTLNKMPSTDAPLQKNDTLTQGSINSGAHIFTLARKWYRTRDINDSKIIEMAQDYDLTLNTLDQAQSARAKSIGVEAEILNKDKKMKTRTIANSELDLKVVGLSVGFVVIMPFAILFPYLLIPILLIGGAVLLNAVMNSNQNVEFVETDKQSFNVKSFLENNTVAGRDSSDSSLEIASYSNPVTGMKAGAFSMYGMGA